MAYTRRDFGYIKFASVFTALSLIFTLSGIFMPLAYRSVGSVIADTDETKITVVIDAGHGGEDGGACTYGGLAEKELNLLISSDLYILLSAAGINVIMTRTDDKLLYDPNSDFKGHKKSMDLAARLKIANNTPDAVLVSIHMNAFPEEKYSGLQVYYSVGAPEGSQLASLIQSNTQRLLDPGNDRKIKPAGKNIYLLDRFDGIGVLVECGFLSNREERARLNNEDYRHQLAFIIFCSLIQFTKLGG